MNKHLNQESHGVDVASGTPPIGVNWDFEVKLPNKDEFFGMPNLFCNDT